MHKLPRIGPGGQVNAEMIVIGIVILALFALVVAVVVQKNYFTGIIATTNENVHQCKSLANLIKNLSSSSEYSETTITITKSIGITGRSITIDPGNCPNCHYCYHQGSVEHYDPDPVTPGDELTPPFTLPIDQASGTGKFTITKAPNEGVTFVKQ